LTAEKIRARPFLLGAPTPAQKSLAALFPPPRAREGSGKALNALLLVKLSEQIVEKPLLLFHQDEPSRRSFAGTCRGRKPTAADRDGDGGDCCLIVMTPESYSTSIAPSTVP
jgi:hypothetical protein